MYQIVFICSRYKSHISIVDYFFNDIIGNGLIDSTEIAMSKNH